MCTACCRRACGWEARSTDGEGTFIRKRLLPACLLVASSLAAAEPTRLVLEPQPGLRPSANTLVAGPHPWADKFVPRHLSDGFGQFPFVYGDPLANQFDGSFLIGFVCKKIPHDSRVSLGIESRDPDVPSY